MSGMKLLARKPYSSDCKSTFSTQVLGDSFSYVLLSPNLIRN
jgi:hypothetical protein